MKEKKKKYPCSLSANGGCEYGGMKDYNFGMISGYEEYCRHPKTNIWVSNMKICPKVKIKKRK